MRPAVDCAIVSIHGNGKLKPAFAIFHLVKMNVASPTSVC